MRNIASSPDLVLAAIVSSRPGLPDSLSFGAPVFADWRAAHSRVGLDGIVLALPPDCQAEIASDIIEAGLPLFMEKPLALSNAAVQRLIQAADTFGFVGLVDHLHLFSPEFRGTRPAGPGSRGMCAPLPPYPATGDPAGIRGRAYGIGRRTTSPWC